MAQANLPTDLDMECSDGIKELVENVLSNINLPAAISQMECLGCKDESSGEESRRAQYLEIAQEAADAAVLQLQMIQNDYHAAHCHELSKLPKGACSIHVLFATITALKSVAEEHYEELGKMVAQFDRLLKPLDDVSRPAAEMAMVNEGWMRMGRPHTCGQIPDLDA